MTTVVISQPMYFPWAGFMGQMARADVLIWLDDAQFSKGSFTNRVQVRTVAGSSWMTIPLVGKGSFQPIAQLSATTDDWRASHRDLVRQQLQGAPHLDAALQIFDAAVAHDTLCDVLIASAEVPGRFMQIMPPIVVRASAMDISGSASRRVLDLVLAVGGTRYLTGHGAANYLDHELFERAGVAVEYMCYDVVHWPQRFDGFTPYVSVLDLVAATGGAARAHIGGRSEDWREFMRGRANR